MFSPRALASNRCSLQLLKAKIFEKRTRSGTATSHQNMAPVITSRLTSLPPKMTSAALFACCPVPSKVGRDQADQGGTGSHASKLQYCTIAIIGHTNSWQSA